MLFTLLLQFMFLLLVAVRSSWTCLVLVLSVPSILLLSFSTSTTKNNCYAFTYKNYYNNVRNKPSYRHYQYRHQNQQQQLQQQQQQQQQQPLDNLSGHKRNMIKNSGATDIDVNTIDPYEAHWKLYPRTHVSYHTSLFTNSTIPLVNTINGDILTKDIWKKVPWSDTFHDIRGNQYDNDNDTNYSTGNKSPLPGITRFKSLYDDTHIYIGGIIYPANTITTEAHFTKRNSPIFQKDSDFEIFIDVNGTTHQYKELEVNAINTVWNLLLDKPYWDGGVEHSGRITNNISDPFYYDTYQQKTATIIWDGIINDSTNNIGALWTIETALSYSDLYYSTAAITTPHTTSDDTATSDTDTIPPLNSFVPKPGTYWRINFSRVEKQGDINWTWQPQIRWDPITQQFIGFIDMHLPDAWGYLYFATTNDDDGLLTITKSTTTKVAPPRDPTWPARLCATTIYYALHYYKQMNGSYTNTLSDLILPLDIIEPFNITIELPNINSFLVSIQSITDTTATATTSPLLSQQQQQRVWATIQTDRYLQAGIDEDDTQGNIAMN
jgi:hypothetical protein